MKIKKLEIKNTKKAGEKIYIFNIYKCTYCTSTTVQVQCTVGGTCVGLVCTCTMHNLCVFTVHYMFKI